MVKMGCKRTEPKKPMLNKSRQPLKPVSQKQAKENIELSKLKQELIILAGNKSELNGEFSPYLDLHHFGGRHNNLLNPFYVILVTRQQHTEEQKHMSYKHKQELRDKIRPIRIAQGFKMEDYE